MKIKPLPKGTEALPGIVTLNNWTMMPDGETYLYVYAHWVIVTDAELGELAGIEGFRSSERWTALGYDMMGEDRQPRAIIPGCQVKALVPTLATPVRQNLYIC